MADEKKDPAGSDPAGSPSGSDAPAAGAAPAAPATVAGKPERFFVKCVAECYRGMDPGNGSYLNLSEGDVAEVSKVKFDQLFADFPSEFAASSESEMKTDLATKTKRQKERLEKKAKKAAAADAAARKTATQDEDDLD